MAGMPIRRERKANLLALRQAGMLDKAVELLFEEVASGLTLRVACKNAGLHYPHVYEYIDEDPDLRDELRIALKRRARSLAESTIELADDIDIESPGDIQKVAMQIKSRQWLAEKDDPDNFGSRVKVENVNINLISIIEEAKSRVANVIEGESVGSA
mgnify:CR=1 FL=1